MAPQAQALSTRSIVAGVSQGRENPRCRLCTDVLEKAQHTVTGCKIRAHTKRYNQVAGIAYRNITFEYGLQVHKSQCEAPQEVVESNRVKILWDFNIQTDKQLLRTNQTL